MTFRLSTLAVVTAALLTSASAQTTQTTSPAPKTGPQTLIQPGQPKPISLSPQAKAADDIRPDHISVLSPQDLERYKRIFALQKAADWAEAERVARTLENRMLYGHVLADRYLSPRYKASYDELKRWMGNYAALPMADRVYRLAMARKPAKAAGPLMPVPDSPPKPTIPKVYTPEELNRMRIAREARASVLQAISAGQPAQAEQRLWAAGRNAFDKDVFSQLVSRVAASYFYQGNDVKAVALGTMGGASSGPGRYLGNWIAGLGAWRQNDCRRASEFFQKAASIKDGDPWGVSAAAFWAARSHLACRRPEQVSTWLNHAAQHDRTFYGLIAARQLGRDISIKFDEPPLSRKNYDRLLEELPARRSIALWEVGQNDASDWELRYLWRRTDDAMHPLILGLASRLEAPSTQVRLAKSLDRKRVVSSDMALFPVPAWQPNDGFKLDRALLFAFMRQESEFSMRAVSRSGARGLMQLMPTTASYIGRDQTLHGTNSDRLYDPGFNMLLGQRYLEYLMGKEFLKTNLFLVAGAYNGGPGNMSRWMQRINYRNDPLLFIETIPAEETRDYIEKVMANLWIYQMRFGQKTPTLDAIASGGWPLYAPQDKPNAPARL